jgi:hypothetical protein
VLKEEFELRISSLGNVQSLGLCMGAWNIENRSGRSLQHGKHASPLLLF